MLSRPRLFVNLATVQFLELPLCLGMSIAESFPNSICTHASLTAARLTCTSGLHSLPAGQAVPVRQNPVARLVVYHQCSTMISQSSSVFTMQILPKMERKAKEDGWENSH